MDDSLRSRITCQDFFATFPRIRVPPGQNTRRATTLDRSLMHEMRTSDRLETSPHSSRRRWLIAFVLGCGVLVNYFDRVNLSVARGALEKEFGISNITFGYLLSAYNWTYAALQLPSGVLLDRIGVQTIGRISAIIWTVACCGGAVSPGLRTFFSSRLLLGVGEAPTFPANAKATGVWFPREERSLATAIFDSAAKFSTAIGTISIGMLIVHFGWRIAFGATGVASFVYFLLFFFLYRDPSKAFSNERKPEAAGGHSSSRPRLLRMALNRKVIGLSLGFAAYNYSFYLLLTWLPAYFTGSLHLSLSRSVIYTSVPWFFATASDLLFGGWLVDWLVRRSSNESFSRQSVLIGGMIIGLAMLGPIFTRTPLVAVAWITIALSGLAASAPVAWSIPSLIAPDGAVGQVGSIMNFANQIAAIAAPVITGYLIGKQNDFGKAFTAAAIALVIGILGYAFLLGRIEPIENDTGAARHSSG